MRPLHRASVFGAISAIGLCVSIAAGELYHRAHPIERITERHTIERIETGRFPAKRVPALRAPRRKPVPHRAPKGRQPGDDIANELNRAWLR